MGEKKRNMDIDRLMTIDDLHKKTQIPMSTLRLWVATGEIPSFKIGRARRFSPKDIEKWLNKKKQ